MSTTKLKQNLFWIVAAVLLAALAGLGFGVLQPKRALYQYRIREISGREVSLRNLRDSHKEGIPSRSDIAKVQAFEEKNRQEIAKLIEFYESKSTPLQKWFGSLPMAPSGEPQYSEFTTRWQTEKQNMDEHLRPPAPEGAESGLSWETIPLEELVKMAPDRRLDLLRGLQKTFWVRKLVHDALKPIVDKERQTTVLRQVAFAEPLSTRFQELAKGSGTTPGNPTDLTRITGAFKDVYPGIPFQGEFEFPGKLGKTITFGVAVQMNLSYLPQFLSSLMNPESDPKVLMELLGVRIFPTGVNPQEIQKQADPGKDKQVRDEALKEVKPVSIEARISARILDFSNEELEKKAKALKLK